MSNRTARLIIVAALAAFSSFGQGITGGGGGTGTGTGNAATEVAVAFSATPAFTCGSITAGTATHFTIATLTGNITSSTLATCTAGQVMGFHFVQDGTGGRTVAMPTNWDSLTIDGTPGVSTDVEYWYDGTNGRLTSVNGKATPFLLGQAPERAAPTHSVSCASGFGALWFDSTLHNLTWCDNAATGNYAGTQTIASGAKALATSLIASAACSAAQTATATGTLTTDRIVANFNGDPTAVTGYVPLTSGMLAIIAYPTVDNVNFKVCNNTASGITPGAVTINWSVLR